MSSILTQINSRVSEILKSDSSEKVFDLESYFRSEFTQEEWDKFRNDWEPEDGENYTMSRYGKKFNIIIVTSRD